MVAYTVDPEALRASAKQVQSIRDAAVIPAWGPAGDMGHAALNDAVGAFTAEVSESWTARTDELDAVASRLRISAELYQRADIESVPFAETGLG
jgi:hypothetical protein